MLHCPCPCRPRRVAPALRPPSHLGTAAGPETGALGPPTEALRVGDTANSGVRGVLQELATDSQCLRPPLKSDLKCGG